jgi:cytochrome c oxidase cbb3-type subunit 3
MKKRIALALLLAATAWPALSMAAPEVQVPWRNVVNPGDTAIFYVLLCTAVMLVLLIWVVGALTSTLTENKGVWRAKWDGKAPLVLALVAASLLPFDLMAQGAATAAAATAPVAAEASGMVMTDSLFWVMVVLNAFLALVLMAMLYNMSNLISTLKAKQGEEAPTWLSRFEHSLTDAVPVELEAEIMTDHEYDGIRELDNKLPPWWLYMFYFTIGFGIVYLYHFHVSEIPGLGKLMLLGQVESGTQLQQYEMAMKEAAEAKAAYLASAANLIDENSVTASTDPAVLDQGREVFKNFCVACHGAAGEGGVGPNLTDQYWMHGGGVKNIFKTIKYGVPAKGMIAWEAQLNPAQMQQVSSFILTLAGTEPANGKAPQGDIWVDGATATDTTAAPTDTTAAAAATDSTGTASAR